MPRDEALRVLIYACPHCDETFPGATPDEHLQITLHRALHVPDRSQPLGHKPQIIVADERTKPVM
jgi:hypothetical protein